MFLTVGKLANMFFFVRNIGSHALLVAVLSFEIEIRLYVR